MRRVINIIVLADWETVISPLVHEVDYFQPFGPLGRFLSAYLALRKIIIS